MDNPFKRTYPHECQMCGLCCQGRGDLWYDEDSWPTDTEPDNCTAFIGGKCNVYDDRRDFCKEYPQDEWCERELKEKGLWDAFIAPLVSQGAGEK